VVEEEVGVDDGSGDRQSAASMAAVATGRVDSGETTRGRLLFIDLKISAAVLV
jgi:hypothetical protein